LTYFWVYVKQFKQISKFLCFIISFFVRKNLLISIKIIYLHKLFSCVWFKMRVFLNPRPPYSLGRQIVLRKIRWHFICSDIDLQIKFLHNLSASSQIDTGMEQICMTNLRTKALVRSSFLDNSPNSPTEQLILL
jgi:hypothetical protein